MKESNISIKESIYESQTHSMKRISVHPPQPTIKQTQKQLLASNKPDDKTFLKYYQQNLQLKNTQKGLLSEIKDLKEKVSKNNQNTRFVIESELKSLATGPKSQWDIKKPLSKQVGSSRGFSGNKKNMSTNKVQHLLEIIDHYKGKLITAEQQITNLRRQKTLLQQDVKLKDRRYQALQEDKPEGSNFQDQINLNEKLKRNIRELQLEKQRSKFLQLGIKNLEAKLRTTEMKAQQIDSLKVQNRSLEQKIIRMTNLPNFNNVIDKADEERRAKQLQSKLKLLNEKYNLLKDNNIKVQAQLKLLQNKLIETTSEIDSLERQNQKLREQSVSNPLLLKLNSNPQLVQKIIIQIQKQKRSAVAKQPQNAKFQIQRLILEKQQLAKQILNYQSKMETLEETYKDRQRLSKLQKQQPLMVINQTKATSKQGVIYDGDATVFSQQKENVTPNTNYFDLFLGQVNILQTMIQSVTGITNPSSPKILATVDFYNHNTEHSKLTQGCRCDLQSQISFKITQDDFFFKYLQKSSFQVDVWGTENNKNYHLGKATIQLKHLINRSRPKVSPVISTSVPLFLNQKVLGSINLVMRMRLPIYEQLQKIRDISAITADPQEETVIRRLVIQIDEGRGFGQKCNTFAYYSFRLQDFYTKASKGNNPNWNHIKLMEINYDNDFKNYLKKNQLQFIVFDDNVIVVDDKNSDVVGSASISLKPLLQGKPIRQRLQIRKGNQRRGTIDIKIFWYEADDKVKNQIQLQEQKKLSPYGIHEQIRSFMKQHSIDAEKVFRLMDDNKTGMISFEEFQEWLVSISARKFTTETVNAYYKQFKQPLNLKNFVARMNLEYSSPVKNEREPVVAGIGMINQFLKINSTQMKKVSLDEFLVGKNVIEIMGQIQTDRAGYITKSKLQEYLDKHGIEAEIQSQRVKLIDYLKKHQKLTLTL